MNRRGSFVGCLLLALPLLGGTVAAAAPERAVGAAQSPKIVAGPNILVSRDGDVAHCETMIAANPRDPANLLGGSITLTRPDGSRRTSPTCRSTEDRPGRTSSCPTSSRPAEMPQVGFGISGDRLLHGSLARDEVLPLRRWRPDMGEGGRSREAPRPRDARDRPNDGSVRGPRLRDRETDVPGSGRWKTSDQAPRRALPFDGRRTHVRRPGRGGARPQHGARGLQPPRAVGRNALHPDVRVPELRDRQDELVLEGRVLDVFRRGRDVHAPPEDRRGSLRRPGDDAPDAEERTRRPDRRSRLRRRSLERTVSATASMRRGWISRTTASAWW